LLYYLPENLDRRLSQGLTKTTTVRGKEAAGERPTVFELVRALSNPMTVI